MRVLALPSCPSVTSLTFTVLTISAQLFQPRPPDVTATTVAVAEPAADGALSLSLAVARDASVTSWGEAGA